MIAEATALAIANSSISTESQENRTAAPREESRRLSPNPNRFVYRSCLAELNGENSRAEIQNVREGSSAHPH